jgi:hypothetical protein
MVWRRWPRWRRRRGRRRWRRPYFGKSRRYRGHYHKQNQWQMNKAVNRAIKNYISRQKRIAEKRKPTRAQIKMRKATILGALMNMADNLANPQGPYLHYIAQNGQFPDRTDEIIDVIRQGKQPYSAGNTGFTAWTPKGNLKKFFTYWRLVEVEGKLQKQTIVGFAIDKTKYGLWPTGLLGVGPYHVNAINGLPVEDQPGIPEADAIVGDLDGVPVEMDDGILGVRNFEDFALGGGAIAEQGDFGVAEHEI